MIRIPCFLVLLLAGCGGKSPAQLEKDAQAAVKSYITGELANLKRAAQDLQTAAPAPDADGWNVTADKAAVDAMRAAWRRTRVAYERIEGAIAVLFPDMDASIDARYDAFLAEGGPDANLFDDQGVTGMHGAERVLFADQMPAGVVDFESKLVGYAAAAFPKNMQEASDFKQKLLQRIVDDAAKMEKDFAPLALDNAAAFRGVIGSMEEQLEKVELAATSEEESRYARHTLSDMRANLEGGQKTFAAFRGWLDAVAADATLPGKIESGFAALAAKYQSLSGDAIPDVPADWNPDMPSASSLASPYGTLRTMLVDACDPKKAGSLVQLMGGAADALGIPQLPQ